MKKSIHRRKSHKTQFILILALGNNSSRACLHSAHYPNRVKKVNNKT
jgi:hypothetical protein